MATWSVFSTLKLIKTDHRSCLNEQHLDDVVCIMVEGPPLSQWDSSRAIQLWWQDKQRRTVSDVRKAPKKKKDRDENNDGSTPCTSETFLNLEDWENLVADNDSTDIYDEDTDSSMEPD